MEPPLAAGAREKDREIKFSRRLIIDETKRAELLSLIPEGQGSWIVRRTAAAIDPADFAAEVAALTAEAAGAGSQPPNAFRRLAVECAPDRIIVAGRAAQRAVEGWCTAFAPSLLPRIEAYAGPPSLFDLHDLDGVIESLSDARVAVPGGGSIIIQPTEALTVIDVNAGAESNSLGVNLAAAAEIARQLRLRHIGGIVVIDFISMAKPRDRERIMAALESALADDPAQTHILPMSAFGLVEMTRERRGPGIIIGPGLIIGIGS